MSASLHKKIIDALLSDGLTIGDFIAHISARQDRLQNEMCEAAEPPCDGVEIDSPTITSMESAAEIAEAGGTYVLAWVWVPLPGAEEAA